MPITTLLNSQESVLQDYEGLDLGYTFRQSWYLQFQNIVKAINGAIGLKLSGVISNSISSVSNSGSGATDLISYDFPKNTFINNQDLMEIEAWGTYAANANNKTVQLKFGSQTIFTTGAIAANNTSWSFKAKIIRTGNSSQEIITEAIYNGSALTTRTAGTQDSNEQITIKCVGTGSSNDDITQRALIIKLTPYI